MHFFWLANQFFSLREIPISYKPAQAIISIHLSGNCGNDYQDGKELPSHLANGLVGMSSVQKLNM
jgi:hypothetical protein